MKFKNERCLRVHSKIHTPKYSCPQCSTGFKKPMDIIKHVRNVHGKENLPFECIYCDFTTGICSEMSKHLRSEHSNAPTYTCLLCKKGFMVYTHFIEHANFHSGAKPFVCELCGKSFPYSRYLSAHKISVHLVTKFGRPKVHECSICKKTYKNRTGLRVHMDLHTGYVLICDICGKSLSTKEKLKQHYRIHTGDKPFKCQYCEKAFSKRYTLVEHERIHTGVKPYQCDFCERSFTQRSTLMTHRRNHTGERPYVCRFCNKGLVSHAMMNIHLKSCKGYEEEDRKT